MERAWQWEWCGVRWTAGIFHTTLPGVGFHPLAFQLLDFSTLHSTPLRHTLTESQHTLQPPDLSRGNTVRMLISVHDDGGCRAQLYCPVLGLQRAIPTEAPFSNHHTDIFGQTLYKGHRVTADTRRALSSGQVHKREHALNNIAWSLVPVEDSVRPVVGLMPNQRP